MGLIFNRYTFRPQEKNIFSILLKWPNNGSVILNEPVVTGQTQVRLTQYLIMLRCQLLIIKLVLVYMAIKCRTLCEI